MILHIVSKSPFSHDALQRCLAVLTPGDMLLLIEDGVLAHASPTPLLPADGNAVFTLSADAAARGISLPANAVDYAGFVDLVARADKSVSWF